MSISHDNLCISSFDIDKNLPKIEVARKSIECLEKFLYEDLELTNDLKSLNINDEHFEEMADRICKNGTIKGFIDLNKEDIVNIFNECI